MPSFSVPTTRHRASLGALFSRQESGAAAKYSKKVYWRTRNYYQR
jgi:hypothetical protein